MFTPHPALRADLSHKGRGEKNLHFKRFGYKFIACAISAEAKIIVSGDKDLLDIGNYKNIEIMKPKEFLEVLHKKA
jgi:hypothetical protein